MAAGANAMMFPMEDIPQNLQHLAAADVLYLWRTPWSDKIAAAVETARLAGAKVVFDVDDLMVDPKIARTEIIDGIRTQFLTEEMVVTHYSNIKRTMLAADICIASTEELAGHMRAEWMPARTLRNSFDHDTLARSRLAARCWTRERDDLLRIGYAAGTPTHQRDFAVCAEAVAKTLRAFPQARLVLFRRDALTMLDVEEFPELRGLEDQIEWRSFVPLERLPEELARFDVNLVPLEVGNPFCEAKSELKFFEAALVDVPTIASPTGPHRRAISNGTTGFLADKPDDWFQALSQLLGKASLRKRVAAAARREVLWSYGPERLVDEVTELLGLLRGGQTAARAFERDILRAAAPPRLLQVPPRVPAHEIKFEHDALGISSVTVIVPLFNYADYVIEALDSVKAQSLAALDLIIVDDSSTDESLAIALNWAQANAERFNRLRVVRNLVNSGLALTRNVGFDLADSPWVLPLDADNRLRPSCAAACLQVAQTSGAAYVYPAIQQFGDASQLISTSPYDPVRLCTGNYIDAMALISSAAWAGVGGYDHIPGGWEDFDLWCRFAERGLRGERVPGEPLAEYRVHAQSMIRTAMASAERAESMIADLTRRHPWLTMVWPLPTPRPAAPPASPVVLSAGGAVSRNRLDKLLPLLRCPEDGVRLSITSDGTALVSESGRSWPIVAGRPNLFKGLDSPHIHPESHVSNPLPENARRLICGASGPVLHLSAGGSVEQFPHVVEVEAAIFRNTNLLADAHCLPFADNSFEFVLALNAFEHYRDPPRAAREILRVLAPEGRVLIRTAFLQPEHEAPWHFYNCTKFGLEAWFEEFETEDLRVSENFHPGHSIAWLASECEAALQHGNSARAAGDFMRTTMGEFVAVWRTPEQEREGRALQQWSDLAGLSQEAQRKIAAGFEFLGRKPSS